jgi:hypothetical protein
MVVSLKMTVFWDVAPCHLEKLADVSEAVSTFSCPAQFVHRNNQGFVLAPTGTPWLSPCHVRNIFFQSSSSVVQRHEVTR